MFDDAAWQKVRAGIAKITDTMKVTLGPTGKNVIIQKSFGNPETVNDGKTIAKEVELPDPFENMGAKMIAEAAEKTAEVVGDGTTTAAILTQYIYENGLRHVVSGANAAYIKKGIDRAVALTVEKLKGMSTPIKNKSDYIKIATVSANHDETAGKLIADAIEKVGREGVITVEESKGRETTLEFAEGMDFDKGYISPYFINKADNFTAELSDPYILICEKKITNAQELLPILQKILLTGKPLLVIAEELEGDAMSVLVANKLQNVFSVCAVKAPAFGDRKKAMLEDIAAVTGGEMISEESGRKLENITLDELGRAKMVRVEKEKTTIIEGHGEKKAINARIEQIRKLLKITTSDYDKEKYEERLAKIQGGVALIKVGAPTEPAMKEKKTAVENSVHAVKAARDEGILPGGGIAYLRTIPDLKKLEKSIDDENEKIGVRIVAEALKTPLRQIAINSGYDGSAIVEEAAEGKGNTGFNAMTGKFVDMLDEGIVDPTKTIRLALQNAASIAGMMLTSRTMITDLKEKKEQIEGSVK
jgi:chaperonin GroEL